MTVLDVVLMVVSIAGAVVSLLGAAKARQEALESKRRYEEWLRGEKPALKEYVDDKGNSVWL